MHACAAAESHTGFVNTPMTFGARMSQVWLLMYLDASVLLALAVALPVGLAEVRGCHQMHPLTAAVGAWHLMQHRSS